MTTEPDQKQINAGDEWYLFIPSEKEPLQPYRSARTVWPLSAEELSRAERQAHSGNASALNNLGTTPHSFRQHFARTQRSPCVVL
jgi:hypothetical protein